MDARITKPEFHSATPSAAFAMDEARSVALAAIRARDEAIGQWIRKAIVKAYRAVVEYPQRRRVKDELSLMTDRELSDIGLSRGDISRVFEGDFEAQASRAANAPAGSRSAA
ncbi:hypothetical protein CR162_07420 [Pseudoroseomonas rhizosphaerae]|uniref:YjiS-like domain-containing protein n=1 Tax=Teichococcus rhizosphaerae TaxID=1335062 RepID=A0A2C7AG51_9PROT|nr:DUF1127 domain-containing protein [Pseudoroseomonas rhizosphaerae]PHK95667.1 hypothetical protein CR162_07420 [Pseudoroseomonas rhizosphaerae]